MKKFSLVFLLGLSTTACIHDEADSTALQQPVSLVSDHTLIPTSTAYSENSRRGELGGGIREASDYGSYKN